MFDDVNSDLSRPVSDLSFRSNSGGVYSPRFKITDVTGDLFQQRMGAHGNQENPFRDFEKLEALESIILARSQASYISRKVHSLKLKENRMNGIVLFHDLYYTKQLISCYFCKVIFNRVFRS